LEECYDLDFLSISITVDMEEFGTRLFSKSAPARHVHLKNYALHTEEERRLFFLRDDSDLGPPSEGS
jgi:hypothetical protein